jgi:hypothetical protein
MRAPRCGPLFYVSLRTSIRVVVCVLLVGQMFGGTVPRGGDPPARHGAMAHQSDA